MAKGKPGKRKLPRYNKKERREFDNRTQRIIDTSNSGALRQITNSMRQGNYNHALRLLQPILTSPNIIAYILALECCAKLKDLETAEKLFEKGKGKGLKEKELAKKMLSVYFNTSNYDLLLTLWNRISQDPDLDPGIYVTMIQFFGTVSQIKEAKEMYEKAMSKLKLEEDRVRCQSVYIKHVLGNTPNISDLIEFFKKLKGAKKLMPLTAKSILDVLYNRRYYDLVETVYSDLPEDTKTIEVEPVLLKIYESSSHRMALTGLEIIYAFALKESGRIDEAKRRFEILLMNLQPTDLNYPRALLGYIFTKPKLTPEEREKYKSQLITLLRESHNIRLRTDIIKALSTLKTL